MAEMKGKDGKSIDQLTKDLAEDAKLRGRLAEDPGSVLGEYGLADIVAQRGIQLKFDIGTGGVDAQATSQAALAIFGIHIDFTGDHIDSGAHWDITKPHNDASPHIDVPRVHADSTHTDIRPHIDI
jgi:hypothetical protein